MSLGRGAVFSSSLKQKLNAKSSTEGDLVGSHDSLSVVFWSKNLIGYQGYTLEHKNVCRYNKSAKLMENNGRESSSRRTKMHPGTVFFIMDQIYQGDVEF